MKVPRSQFIDRFVPPAISQVTKHVELQLIQYINKFVAVLIVIQRQVPQVQTVPETAAVPTAQSVGRVVDVPVIMQIMTLVHKVIEEPVAKPRQAWNVRGHCASAQSWRRS